MTADLVTLSRPALPAPILALGDHGTRRFVEFFTAHVRNKNTRKAYALAVRRLCDWCQKHRLALIDINPITAALYMEEASAALALSTRKQHLSAISKLYDYLVTGGVVPFNPFQPVRLERYSQRTGKTPAPTKADIRALFDVIPTDTLLGLRDRAIIACMLFTCMRVSALTGLRIKDYEASEREANLAVLDKGGKWQRLPCHHRLARHLDAYLVALKDQCLDQQQAAGVAQTGLDRNGPLFRRARGRSPVLSTKPLTSRGVLKITKRHAKAAGLPENIGNHGFRVRGLSDILAAGGTLQTAAKIAGHASTQTTMMYNRAPDEDTRGVIELLRY